MNSNPHECYMCPYSSLACLLVWLCWLSCCWLDRCSTSYPRCVYMCVSLKARWKREARCTYLILYLSPQAVLACINVTSLRQMFLQFQDLPELWRISKIDFVRALINIAIFEQKKQLRFPFHNDCLTGINHNLCAFIVNCYSCHDNTSLWPCLCVDGLGGNLAVCSGT